MGKNNGKKRYRIRGKRRRGVVRHLEERDGLGCAICHVADNRPEPLFVDHINNDPKDNRLENLRLLCRSCNGYASQYKGEGGQRDGQNGAHPPLSDADRASRSALAYTYKNVPTPPIEDVILPAGSPTAFPEDVVPKLTGPQYKNRDAEPRARAYMVKRVREVGRINRAALIEEAAEYAGCSIGAVSGYLRKLASALGPLQATAYDGVWIVELREEGHHDNGNTPIV